MAVKKVDLNDRVAITNLRSWALHFRAQETARDIQVPAGAKAWKRLTVAEVDSQVKAGNTFFCGTDGLGSNAAIKIDDDAVRRYVFALDAGDDHEQTVLTLDAVKDLVTTTPKAAFLEKLKKLVVTEGDRRMIVALATEAGIENAEAYKVTEIEKLAHTQFDE